MKKPRRRHSSQGTSLYPVKIGCSFPRLRFSQNPDTPAQSKAHLHHAAGELMRSAITRSP